MNVQAETNRPDKDLATFFLMIVLVQQPLTSFFMVPPKIIYHFRITTIRIKNMRIFHFKIKYLLTKSESWRNF